MRRHRQLDRARTQSSQDQSCQGRPLLQVLRIRSFALFFAGQTVSSLGNGIYRVALGWTVYSVTRSAADMGAVLAVNMVPSLIFTIFGGVLADRVSRRFVIISADCVSAVTTGALAVQAAHRVTFAALLTVSAVLGIASSMCSPAYRAIVPDVVPEGSYGAANGIVQAGNNVAQIVGPGIAGVIYALGGPPAAFGADSASFAVAVVAMIFTSVPRRGVGYNRAIWAEMTEGVRYSYRMVWLRIVMALSLAANTLCLAPFFVLLPLLVRQAGGSSSDLGIALALQVGTTAVTGLWLGRRKAVSQPGLLLCVLTSFLGLGTAVVGIGRSIPLILAGSGIIGVGFGFDVIETSLLQVQVPHEIISRVFSVNIVSSFAALPVGYVAVGVLQKDIGTAPLLTAGGGLLILIALAMAGTTAIRALGGIRPSAEGDALDATPRDEEQAVG